MFEMTAAASPGCYYVLYPAPAPALLPYDSWVGIPTPSPVYAFDCSESFFCGIMLVMDANENFPSQWTFSDDLTQLGSGNGADVSGAILVSCGSTSMYGQMQPQLMMTYNVSIATPAFQR